MSNFQKKSITKVYGSTLLHYEGVGGCQLSMINALRDT